MIKVDIAQTRGLEASPTLPRSGRGSCRWGVRCDAVCRCTEATGLSCAVSASSRRKLTERARPQIHGRARKCDFPREGGRFRFKPGKDSDINAVWGHLRPTIPTSISRRRRPLSEEPPVFSHPPCCRIGCGAADGATCRGAVDGGLDHPVGAAFTTPAFSSRSASSFPPFRLGFLTSRPWNSLSILSRIL